MVEFLLHLALHNPPRLCNSSDAVVRIWVRDYLATMFLSGPNEGLQSRCLFPCWCCRCPRHILTRKPKSCSIYLYIASNHRYSQIGEQVNSILALHQSINGVTMSMCDVLLCHCRTVLLYVWGYAIAHSDLICILGLTYTYTVQVAIDTTKQIIKQNNIIQLTEAVEAAVNKFSDAYKSR